MVSIAKYPKQTHNNISTKQIRKQFGVHIKLIGLQASVFRNVGSTHGRPIISNISFSERGNVSRESCRRVLPVETQTSVSFFARRGIERTVQSYQTLVRCVRKRKSVCV
jgi:hypothetical protein